MKTCTKCFCDKALDEFNKHKQCKDGINSHCRQCENAKSRAYRAANKEKTAAAVKAWVEKNRERSAAIKRKWKEGNKGLVNAGTRARQARKLHATPPWANLAAIKSFYEEAAALDLEVDHVVPLRGKKVSGLHVEYNLQLLTQADNQHKSNRLPKDLS